MAVEATPAARFTAVVDNVLGIARSNPQLTAIGARFAESLRPEIIAAGQNPDALTNPQRATWALLAMERVLRQYHRHLIADQRAPAENTAVNTEAADMTP